MKTVIILKGLPASGKTSWSKEKVVGSNCAIKRVNKDDLREMLDTGKWSKANEKFVLNLRDLIILTSLAQGKHVIVDDTNLHPKHEKHIRELVKGKNVQVKIREFIMSPEECIERDLKRPNSVGSKVIWNMYNLYLKPKEESENKPEVLKQDKSLPHAIIVDLDGSLALHNGRTPFEYHKCHTDLLNIPIADLIQNMKFYQGTKLIFLSGREDSCKELTEAWLGGKGFNDYLLFMRKSKDFRKDTVIKKELFEKEIKDKYYVNFVIDDRPCVIRMWKELGLFVFNVGDGIEF